MGKRKLKLAEVIKKEMEGRNESFAKVSKACGMPQSVLHGWANNVAPSGKNFDHLLDLAEYWGLSIDYLLLGPKNAETELLFAVPFCDGGQEYRILIEKLKN